jgi:ubiquinone/menaquinone biosynthesis C-methylase UbiE
MASFDYERSDLHRRYEKARALSPETVLVWMRAIDQHVPSDGYKRIIDLGCGTGRFANTLHAHFNASVFAVDPSRNMVSQCAPDPHVYRIQGRAEAIPIANTSADMVFMSMAWHHIEDKRKAADEITRVLRHNGRLFIRTCTVETLNTYLYLRFFPTASRINQQTLPARQSVMEVFQDSGLCVRERIAIRQRLDSNLFNYADRIAQRGYSDLASISDEEFHEGLAQLQSFCHFREQEHGNQAVHEDLDLFVFERPKEAS